MWISEQHFDQIHNAWNTHLFSVCSNVRLQMKIIFSSNWSFPCNSKTQAGKYCLFTLFALFTIYLLNLLSLSRFSWAQMVWGAQTVLYWSSFFCLLFQQLFFFFSLDLQSHLVNLEHLALSRGLSCLKLCCMRWWKGIFHGEVKGDFVCL